MTTLSSDVDAVRRLLAYASRGNVQAHLRREGWSEDRVAAALSVADPAIGRHALARQRESAVLAWLEGIAPLGLAASDVADAEGLTTVTARALLERLVSQRLVEATSTVIGGRRRTIYTAAAVEVA